MSINPLKITSPTVGATLLVSGCCIGAGMLGLPVLSAPAGFIPTALAMAVVYLFTTLTGLLVLEATLWFPHPTNLLSMAEHTLGKNVKYVAMLLFLTLFYCLFVAYLDAGGALLAECMSFVLHTPITRNTGIVVLAVLIGSLTYSGVKIVDTLNRFMLVGLISVFLGLPTLGLSRFSSDNLAQRDWTAMLATVPILLVCFGYQNLVPSLAAYLNNNLKALRCAIIVGNLIPFVIYLAWNAMILGMLTARDLHIAERIVTVAALLALAAPATTTLLLMKIFSLLAILTSFLPNALSFLDFIRDGIKSKQKNHFVYYVAVFLPPTLCSVSYPRLFLRALEMAGGCVDVLLFGILPALIVMRGRAAQAQPGAYKVPGGKLSPYFVLIMACAMLTIKFS